MSVELTKYVEIKISSLDEPLRMTVDEAMELRTALLEAFPVSTTTPPRPPSEKWVLRKTSWIKGGRSVSVKLVAKVLNVIGEKWNTIDNICDVLGYSRNMIMGATTVLVQEGKLRSRGRGKTLTVQLKTQTYTPQRSDKPKIDSDDGTHDLSALEKEEKLRRDATRQQ